MDKRTHTQENAQPQQQPLGVGARSGASAAPPQGGGYLNTYRFCELEKQAAAKKIDPRLLQLREIGLNATMQKIAAEIGVDNFLRMWSILDADEALRSDSGALVVRLRSFKAWQRNERIRFVKALAHDGQCDKSIQKRVANQFDENLHPTYISRLKRK